MRLSPKHGVNPSIAVCFYCGEDTGEIILAGLMRGGHDPEAPRQAVWNRVPCDKCKALMAQGVMLIEADDAKTTDPQNPYRTGHMTVIKEEAVRRLFKADAAEGLLKSRVAFLSIEAWDLMGIPRALPSGNANTGDDNGNKT